jgi:recombinational DNA repair protein (RecF pathway)
MKCVLCEETTTSFGFYTQSSDRSICLDCFQGIKKLNHYAPYPTETGEK